jgi:hypothetical protein
MDEQVDRVVDQEIETTSESLQAAYNRLFSPGARLPENDSYSLAQPYAWRSVPSFASDSTQPLDS